MKHLEPYPGESEQDYRRRIISDFVSEVYLYDDRLLIYFNISSEDGKLKSTDLSNIEGGEFDEGLVSSEWRESNSRPLEPHCASLKNAMDTPIPLVRSIIKFQNYFIILFR